MLKRVWRGWTSPANADAYEDLLRATIFPGIVNRKLDGFLGIELLLKPLEAEVEFMTIMTFADRDAIVRFAGPAHETAVVPPGLRAFSLSMVSRSE